VQEAAASIPEALVVQWVLAAASKEAPIMQGPVRITQAQVPVRITQAQAVSLVMREQAVLLEALVQVAHMQLEEEVLLAVGVGSTLVAITLQVAEWVLESLSKQILDVESVREQMTLDVAWEALRRRAAELAALASTELVLLLRLQIGRTLVKEEATLHRHHLTLMLVKVQALSQERRS